VTCSGQNFEITSQDLADIYASTSYGWGGYYVLAVLMSRTDIGIFFASHEYMMDFDETCWR